MSNMNQRIDKRGWLIALEGIDGAGKRTWTNFLEKRFTLSGFSVKSFEYPDYNSPWGGIIKRYLDNELELSPTEQFFTYFTDIFKDQVRIRNLLYQGCFVIIDRYFASTIAFQCAKGFSYEIAFNILEATKPLVPDIVFFIDVTPKTAMERCLSRKPLDRHERDLDLLRNVARLYRKIIREGLFARKWIIVNGNKDLKTLKNLMEKKIAVIIDEWNEESNQ